MREPPLDQIPQKHRPVDAGLPLAECRTEVWIRHAPAAAIGVDHPLKRPTDAGDHLRQRGKVRRMVFGDQDVRVFGLERVAPRLRRCGGRFDPGQIPRSPAGRAIVGRSGGRCRRCAPAQAAGSAARISMPCRAPAPCRGTCRTAQARQRRLGPGSVVSASSWSEQGGTRASR